MLRLDIDVVDLTLLMDAVSAVDCALEWPLACAAVYVSNVEIALVSCLAMILRKRIE
jgi:hypothetical protein